MVGVVAGSLSSDISKKTHPADDTKSFPIFTVRVHVCVCGVDCTLSHGDPTVSSDTRDVVIVISTKCEASDGATVFDPMEEVS